VSFTTDEMNPSLQTTHSAAEDQTETFCPLRAPVSVCLKQNLKLEYTDLTSLNSSPDFLFRPCRALLERDRVIEDLRLKLRTKEKEVDSLFQRNSYLAREVRYLSDVIQHLNQKLAELEADQQEAREKIRSLLNRRLPAVPPVKTITEHTVEPGQLRQVSRLTRELNVSNKQLRSTVQQALTDMKNQLEQLKGAAGKLPLLEQEAAGEVEELRSLYRKEAVERKSLYNKLLELQGNIRVFCRCRRSDASSLPSEQHTDYNTRFGSSFLPSFLQEDVFAGTLPVITSCVDGYNVCILAYGQTGSGKTYTMMGSKENPGNINTLLTVGSELHQTSAHFQISMLDIYNETLNDLLTKSSDAALDIRVQGKSVSVPGLTRIQVQTEADILAVMETGEKNRKIASTKMNTQSSRSHLVVALEVEGSDEVSGLTSRGTLTLCDLAGSERISKTEAEGQRLVEAAAINKSLTALGQVFSALRCNALHVPFRNSKLTLLLQPCLSGDAKVPAIFF
uniref:Kinesin-like protein n=1 Tax=Sparus aurata TaxID=8175 RepID=A0A671TU67_SPAAU